MGLLLAYVGAITTAFDRRFVGVPARGAWSVAGAEPRPRPNAHGSTGGDVGGKLYPPFGDRSGMFRGLSLDGCAGRQYELLPPA